MNLVILINSAQLFFRNFGLRQVNATLGHFAIQLAGPNACQKIARFAVPLEWLRSLIILRLENSSRRQSHERVSPVLAGIRDQ
jgi:hypothetical protein